MTKREYIESLDNETLGKTIRKIGNSYMFKFVDYGKWLASEYTGNLDFAFESLKGEDAEYKNDPSDESFPWMKCKILGRSMINGRKYVEIVNERHSDVSIKIPEEMLRSEHIDG